MRAIILILALPLLIAVISGSSLAMAWQTETVDSDGNTGYFISLALDSNDRPHISYWDGTNTDLKYSYWDETAWVIETVDSDGSVGFYLSLAIDAYDRPHISYHYVPDADLRYARWDGANWSIETVDSAGVVGRATSLALDDNDWPHISYATQSSPFISPGVLKYARWDGMTWTIQTIDTLGSNAESTSLALDSAGRPHISYYDAIHETLKYAHWDGSTWLMETVDSSPRAGFYSSLALDADDQPHIAYFDFTTWDLKYTYWDGNAWQTETVDSAGLAGRTPSLDLDADDRPHISYLDETNGDLKYVYWDGSVWQSNTVDSAGSVGWYSSIELDSVGRPHIGYQDYTNPVNTDLKYAVGEAPIGYSFSGFFPPVDNPPKVNLGRTGSAIPVRFSLGGDFGLDVFAEGYPLARRIACPGGSIDIIEETVPAIGNSLQYDPLTDQYTYVWKTAKSWKGCRELILKFNDNTTSATALFKLQ